MLPRPCEDSWGLKQSAAYWLVEMIELVGTRVGAGGRKFLWEIV